jgi:hypothetical protein
MDIADDLATDYSRPIRMCLFNLAHSKSTGPPSNQPRQHQPSAANNPITSQDIVQLALDLAESSSEHMQKKCVEVVHEVQWLHLYQSLSDSDRKRLLDNAGRFGRAWMFALPTSPVTTLTDAQVRYGLRCALLDPLLEVQSTTNVCECGQHDGPMHHLGCANTSSLRTKRHNAICLALKEGIESFGTLGGVKSEVQLAHGVVADLLIDMDLGRWKAVDVAVVSPHRDTAPEPDAPDQSAWPTHLRNSATGPVTPHPASSALQAQHQAAPAPHPLDQIVEYRKGCWDGAVGLTIARAEQRKKHHYRSISSGPTSLAPFIITTGGSVGSEASEFWKLMQAQAKVADNGAAKLRFLSSRIGIVLLRFNTSIAQARSG